MIKIYLTELEGLMLREKPYREPDLTLPDLAQRLDVPPNYLSQVINERMGYNFFDYINSLRINDAKKLLTDAQYIDQSVMQMAYSVGFNSKSTFNSAFKKFTGETPTAFKSSALESSLT